MGKIPPDDVCSNIDVTICSLMLVNPAHYNKEGGLLDARLDAKRRLAGCDNLPEGELFKILQEGSGPQAVLDYLYDFTIDLGRS